MTFQLESWAKFFPDAQVLMPIHWAELALDKDKFVLGVDAARFQSIDEQGLLHILTVRDDGRLVGYYIAIVMPHLHYKDSGLMAFTDMYFLHPEFRKASNGVKLFTEAERTLRERGVKKAYLSCKVHQDHSRLFEHLGWKLSDKAFVKVFGS